MTIIEKVSEDIREEVKDVGRKPNSLTGYYLIGSRYIAKKVIYFCLLGIVVGAALFVQFGFPWIQAKFLTRTFVVNSEDMFGYTGRVRLLADKTGRNVLFTGQMEEGRITGRGTLYDYNGSRMYQGNFLMEMYEGDGETFYPNGQTCYKGKFLANQYEGKGTLYYQNGNTQYEGEFVQGLYEGKGNLYYENSVLEYKGGFASGVYEGKGELYDAGGSLVYEGNFSGGKKSGEG